MKTLLSSPRSFPIWRPIQLGTFNSLDELKARVAEVGCRLDPWGTVDLLDSPIFTSPRSSEFVFHNPKVQAVSLCLVTTTDLGFTPNTPVSFATLCGRAIECGLSLCPPEVGPQLRIQYLEQPIGEWVYVAMDPITDSLGFPDIFALEHDKHTKDLWLKAADGRLAKPWFEESMFVFVQK